MVACKLPDLGAEVRVATLKRRNKQLNADLLACKAAKHKDKRKRKRCEENHIIKKQLLDADE
jgi:hypothetical protein